MMLPHIYIYKGQMKMWPSFTSALAQRDMDKKKKPNILATLNFFVGDSSKHMVKKSDIQTEFI